MVNDTISEINASSMQIILHAGNARDLYNEAIDCVETGCLDSYQELLQKAEKEITLAHKIQTKLLQDAIDEENPSLPLLLIHAQDTLMTVDCEFRIIGRLISMYKKILNEKTKEGETK